MKKQIHERLCALTDKKYRDFTARLLPPNCPVMGVRLPELRKLAKEIAAGDWRAFLADPPHKMFEETMLHGMVIGYIKTDDEERLKQIAAFIPLIDNWSVCDSFCSGLKFTLKAGERIWEFLQPYLYSADEFEARFGIVMLLQYFTDESNIDRTLQALGKIRPCGYYAKMAAAWAISMCYVKAPEKTYEFLNGYNSDDFIFQKSLQKIIESKQPNSAQKAAVRKLAARNSL